MLAVVVLMLTVVAAKAAEWVYAHEGATSADEAAQTATWGGLCARGTEQSPIDVVTADVVSTALPNIDTHFTSEFDFVKNSVHGFQLFETSPRTHLFSNGTGGVDALGTPKGYSMIGGQKFNLYQVQWHAPSENIVDGQSFPLEAHFVHQLDDPALVGTYHQLAVVGLLYELGECNAFLDKFWSEFPTGKGAADFSAVFLDFNHKLTDELSQGYYHWYGSLTTPPCIEGVSWNLLKVRQTVCQGQIDLLKTALGNTQHGIKFNNRVTQPLNYRAVTNAGVAVVPAVAALAPSLAPACDDEEVHTQVGVTQIVTWATSLTINICLVLFIMTSWKHSKSAEGGEAADDKHPVAQVLTQSNITAGGKAGSDEHPAAHVLPVRLGV